MSDTDAEDNEYLKLLCMMLFSIGMVEDTLYIWKAKKKNFDAGIYIDAVLLCGAGVMEYLAGMHSYKHYYGVSGEMKE
ncbi:hypothetical protein M3231_11010 [Neobacillus mesonae]|nr:hypothetical protein [Neobacillus mesonae]